MFNKERCFLIILFIFFIYFFYSVKFETSQVSSLKSLGKVQKIVSLSPSNTEILFALGVNDEIVGVTTYCDYPKEALQKEKIGGFYNPNIEKIVSLSPDLVLADASLHKEAIVQLKRAGINVVAVNNETLDQCLDSIKNIASLVNRQKEGEILQGELVTYCEQAEQRLSKVKVKKKIFVEVWDHPLLTVGKKSYLNDLVSMAGGINIARSGDYEYYNMSFEDIYNKEPDIYLRLRGTDMGSKADSLPLELKELSAVKNDKVVTVFGDWIVRIGPRSFIALGELIDAIYPEIDKEVY